MKEPEYVATMHELDEPTCRRLLARTRFGRIAFTTPRGPMVLPVNVVVADDVVYFRTAAGSSLDGLADGTAVAFEVDEVDRVAESGWSVLANGDALRIVDPVVEEMLAAFDLHPWAPGRRDILVGVRATTVSGRRIDRHALLAPGAHLPVMPPD